jgi:ankyrin repeat protein
LKPGASVEARDVYGRAALHWAHNPEKARLLAANGADINARASPRPDDSSSTPYTPLQLALLLSKGGDLALVKTLLELGADAKLMDGMGNSTLAYCLTIDAFKLIQGYGLDVKELLPKGRTLLHNIAVMTSAPRTTFPEEIAFFKFLIGLGIDINAQDENGQTLLHFAAARETYDEFAPNYELLIANGADKSIKDKTGKRAFDLTAKSLTKVRAVLK